MLRVARVPVHMWAELHHMMCVQDFPDVPANYGKAKGYLDDVDIYGAFDEKSRLIAGFVFGHTCDESAFLDVVCAPSAHGKWATRHVLKQLHNIAFIKMGLRFIWVQPKNKRALNAALKAGFVYASQSEGEAPVLILTRQNVRKKLINSKKGKENGKPI